MRSMHAPASLANHFLIAMPGMDDPNFSGGVALLCHHSAEGAMGLVLNRASEYLLGEVMAQMGIGEVDARLAAQPVLAGGPVEPERGFVLHTPGDETWDSTYAISSNLSLTTSRDVLEALSNGAGPRKVFITLGYSGWTAGQLEEEISRNGWLNVDADPQIIFDTPVEQRYDKALSLLGIDRSFLMGEAGHA